MLHYVLRRKATAERRDPEPLALMKVNANQEGDMTIGLPRPTRLGYMAPISRNGQHVYNLNVDKHDDVQAALFGVEGWYLQMITQAEWETWAEMELFPVLRLGMAR